jgi:hypothetical protein
MDWRILVNCIPRLWLRQSMLKLPTHSGFHDLFDGNLYLRLRKMSQTIYVAIGKVSHIHMAHVLMRLYRMNNSLVC